MSKKRKSFIFIFTVLGIGFYVWFNYAMPMTKNHIPVDKIYVINLDKSKNRLDVISKQLRAQNLEFTRFPAVLGLDLKIENEQGHVFYGRDLKSKKEEFRIGEQYKVYCPSITINYQYRPSLARHGLDPLSAGEFGIYCSHFEIMRDTIRNRYKSVVVLEDDVIIPENFAEELRLIEQNMPDYRQFDIIFLGYYASGDGWFFNKLKKKHIMFNDDLDKVTSFNKMTMGTVRAILYSYVGAGRILDSIEPNVGIDFDLFMEANNGLLQTYVSRRLMVDSGNYRSIIDEDGRSN